MRIQKAEIAVNMFKKEMGVFWGSSEDGEEEFKRHNFN
jgi:hypothetical protein